MGGLLGELGQGVGGLGLEKLMRGLTGGRVGVSRVLEGKCKEEYADRVGQQAGRQGLALQEVAVWNEPQHAAHRQLGSPAVA